jgi:signal transduction histidine kinase
MKATAGTSATTGAFFRTHANCRLAFARVALSVALMGMVVCFGLANGFAAGATNTNATESPAMEATSEAEELGVGAWIWTTNTEDKQTIRLWRTFTVPGRVGAARAILRITADNGYRVFLDGREVGRGGDWKYLTEYDLTWLMPPGQHVMAIEAINDALDAGVILGLHVELVNGEKLDVLSDPSWLVAPLDDSGWLTRKHPRDSWFPARIVGFAGLKPWWDHPYNIIHAQPLQPVALHFWQQSWFLALLLIVCAAAAVLCVRQAAQLAVQSRAQMLLERERSRIARDIHDDLGAGLTQLTLVGELVLREVSHNGETHKEVDSLCNKARALLGSLDEIVWAVNPKRDTVADFAVFVSQYAQEFLSASGIKCRLDLAEDLPNVPLDLPARRNLLLAVKEALRNAASHSGASEVFLGVRVTEAEVLEVVVEDNGTGFSAGQVRAGRNGLSNMETRLAEVGGACEVASSPGAGCRVKLTVPVGGARGWLAVMRNGLGRERRTTEAHP